MSLHEQEKAMVRSTRSAMVNSPNPSLRFSLRSRSSGATSPSTRHDDGQRPLPFDAPERKHNNNSSNNGANTSTSTTSNTTHLNRPSHARTRFSPLTRTNPSIASLERPMKKAKLDNGAYDLPGSPEPPEKLPLRSDTQKPPGAIGRKSRKDLNPSNNNNTSSMSPLSASAPRVSSPPPALAVASSEKRSLRSQDSGSKLKSELALYFSNYEQILSLEPEKPGFLSPGTTLFLDNDLSESLFPQPNAPQENCMTGHMPNSHVPGQIPDNPLLNLYDAQMVESPNDIKEFTEDPLLDDIYFKAHRRYERQEKHLKNIERDRAQHEKIQLERILGELQGHDWLRVMGVSGITNSEKNLYKPKRDYFIKEVTTLIDKFQMWKDEEKQRKVKKGQRLAAENEDEDDNEEEKDSEEPGAANVAVSSAVEEQLPHIDDVDGWAAHQLQQEAMSASRKKPKLESSRSRTGTAAQHKPNHSISRQQPILIPRHPETYKPFLSFYDKPHLRAAAVGPIKKRGHVRMAFGQPLPEMPERDFCLPDDILTQEAIAAASRRNRVRRREQRKQ